MSYLIIKMIYLSLFQILPYNIEQMKRYWLLAVFLILFTQVFSYLELQIFRYELRDTLKNGSIKCITKEDDKKLQQVKKQQKQKKKSQKKKKSKRDDEDDDDDEEQSEQQIDDDLIQESNNYQEICYQKDLSYSLPMYLNNNINLISLDTTAPISWFKGDRCHIQGTTKKCSKISQNMKDKISNIFKKKSTSPKHSSEEYAIIEGSSELVKGIQQKTKNFQFVTRDSSRLTNLFELLMLGFYVKGEKDHVILEQTNFINATEISINLNYLCDGAISLRFDDRSESSFLKQLLQYQQISDKYVTINIVSSSVAYVAVGQVASKFSKNGFGGLQWITVKTDEKYGKLPTITDIIIQNEDNHMFSEIRQKQYPAVISLSASYIGIPKLVMAQWLKKFNKKSNCEVNEKTKYLQCKSLKEKQESKIITFEFEGKKISFKLSELILGKTKSKTTLLNIKQTLHDTYAILGEPFFIKYLVVFDYANNRVGVGEKSDKADKDFIDVISLIRFVCFVFAIGCSFILCFLPIKRCISVFRSKSKFGATQSKGQTRRLKSYSPIQQNPYDQLSGKIKQALEGQEIN